MAAKTHTTKKYASYTPKTPPPTKTPIPSPIYTPTPTKKVKLTPTATISPTSKLTTPPAISTATTDYILQKVNEYRVSLGISRAESNAETCSFAKLRAEEISRSFTHDGFKKRVDSKTLPYSDYHEVTENIAYNSDYKDVVTRWITSSGHAENMRADTPFICIGKLGDYYSYEGWKP